MKILVVDDERDIQTLFEQRFRKEIRNAEMNFVFAFSGEEALQFMQANEHEAVLILSDINMPVTNGFRLREIILSDPQTNCRNVPYIFFTTSTMLKVVANGKGPTFQGIFKKPARHSEWKETLSSIVKYWTLSMPPDEYEL